MNMHIIKHRGAVGETTFHVCFLMGTPTHMYCAKRILKWYPKLLHDIYLSEVSRLWWASLQEYYGENVLHMGCVAEDASLVKWLLDIGSDFHRRCYGNFFCCDDQKAHRTDSRLGAHGLLTPRDHEAVDVPLRTNYLGEVTMCHLHRLRVLGRIPHELCRRPQPGGNISADLGQGRQL